MLDQLRDGEETNRELAPARLDPYRCGKVGLAGSVSSDEQHVFSLEGKLARCQAMDSHRVKTRNRGELEVRECLIRWKLCVFEPLGKGSSFTVDHLGRKELEQICLVGYALL